VPGWQADSPCPGTLELVDELTEELIIASGGWHPRYARVLLIQQIGDQAIVLVDGNGDGAEVESERWSRTSRGVGRRRQQRDRAVRAAAVVDLGMGRRYRFRRRLRRAGNDCHGGMARPGP
jgi:hypothetical protein